MYVGRVIMTDLELKGELIGQGNTAEIFAWGEQNILKLYRNGLSEDLCSNEFAITQYVYEHFKIAPKPLEIVHIDGRIGAIYQRLDGKTMLKELLSKPWRLRKYSKLLARSHVDMHQKATLSAVTVKEKLKREIQNVALLSLEEKQLLNYYLDNLPEGDCICHFDFHPDNIILMGDKYYVIDWMTGCMGDPLADVARTALMLNYAEIPRVPKIVNVLVKLFQKRIYRTYISEYLKLTGSALSDVAKWELPIAAARLNEWIPEGEAKKLLELVKRRIGDL